ncbi:MAG: chorismate mutase [Kiritimatiellae bacterium]|nr:chorismate mutase [Kiritimatiellia bacterium]MDW8458405.1 chorismate mutase [Verrucomicrobiota bacterium]
MKRRPVRKSAHKSSAGGGSATSDSRMEALRRRIDALDAEIVALLNERCRVARQIGEIKRANGGALYVPEREQAVLARIRELNRGPMDDRALEAIYREIMSAALAVEGPLKIGVAGAPGSPAAEAARNHFGASAKLCYVDQPSKAVEGIRRRRWDALCMTEPDLPAACADLQAGRLRVCARVGKGICILVRNDAPQLGAERGPISGRGSADKGTT